MEANDEPSYPLRDCRHPHLAAPPAAQGEELPPQLRDLPPGLLLRAASLGDLRAQTGTGHGCGLPWLERKTVCTVLVTRETPRCRPSAGIRKVLIRRSY